MGVHVFMSMCHFPLVNADAYLGEACSRCECCHNLLQASPASLACKQLPLPDFAVFGARGEHIAPAHHVENEHQFTARRMHQLTARRVHTRRVTSSPHGTCTSAPHDACTSSSRDACTAWVCPYLLTARRGSQAGATAAARPLRGRNRGRSPRTSAHVVARGPARAIGLLRLLARVVRCRWGALDPAH
jgi:hypothetical protein